MAKIRISPDEVRTLASSYGQQGAAVEQIIGTMDGLKEQLMGVWEGNAADAFAGKYDELRPSFVKMRELIEDINKALTKSANLQEQTDDSIASSFQ